MCRASVSVTFSYGIAVFGSMARGCWIQRIRFSAVFG